MYSLIEYDDRQVITGSFNESELQRVDKDENSLWIIDKVLRKRRRGGKTQLFVHFQGWPDRYNIWVAERDIHNLS